MDFLAAHDKEETTEHIRLDKNGQPVLDEANNPLPGRARPIPKSGVYGQKKYRGEVIQAIWQDSGNGPAVMMGSKTITIRR